MNNTTVDDCIREYAETYPPLITLDQAAQIAQRSVNTIYDWSSRGLLESFKMKPGKRCLLALDGFVRFLMQRRSGG